MPDATSLLLFTGASLLLIVAPGPDLLYLVSQGAAHGPRAGLATACGLAAGNLVHTLAAALGISVLFQGSALAFEALKLAGVAYLLYLAWCSVRAPAPAVAAAAQAAPAAHGPLFWRGLLMNVLNPKVALFFLAFLPQFADPASGPVWLQLVLLGSLFTALVVLVFGAFGLAAGQLRPWLQRAAGGAAGRYAGWAIALLFVALAVRLGLAER